MAEAVARVVCALIAVVWAGCSHPLALILRAVLAHSVAEFGYVAVARRRTTNRARRLGVLNALPHAIANVRIVANAFRGLVSASKSRRFWRIYTA